MPSALNTPQHLLLTFYFYSKAELLQAQAANCQVVGLLAAPSSDRVCDVKMWALSFMFCSVLRSRTLYSCFQTCS